MPESPVPFFDPRAPVGLLVPAAGEPLYPDPCPAGAVKLELLDAELQSSGRIVLQLDGDGGPRQTGMLDVREGADGCLALVLESGDWLLFSPDQRARASAVVLKLTTGYF
ncbi:MAG: hypothetical protein R3202_10890 [Candidatus Competibacterales bacterium]|nr:hypothetical protein [Candidatus Competibacterales bacterium]